MYFHSRYQAGRMLAAKLAERYRYENCSIVALDDGGVVIGSEIAKQLHCGLSVTVSEEIKLPNEPYSVGGITQDGQFVDNPQYTKADIEELQSENRGYIEEQRISKFHEVNKLLSNVGVVDRSILVGQNIILASEGLANSFKLEIVLQYVKPINYVKIIVATPIASVSAVDWVHVHADEIYCLSVIEDYVDTNHYYDVQDIPNKDTITKVLQANILNWQ